jgi:F0F1-type ATP synthase membrane subunit b/b'
MDAAPSFYDQLAQWSEIVGGFAFIIVAVLLFRKFLQPAVRAAQAAGNADLVLAETRREQLKVDVVKARAELESADRDALAIKQRAGHDAVLEHDRLLAEARTDGQRAVANAEKELSRARVVAQAKLRAEFIDRALQLARSKADSRIDDAVNSRLVSATVQALLADNVGSAA